MFCLRINWWHCQPDEINDPVLFFLLRWMRWYRCWKRSNFITESGTLPALFPNPSLSRSSCDETIPSDALLINLQIPASKWTATPLYVYACQSGRTYFFYLHFSKKIVSSVYSIEWLLWTQMYVYACQREFTYFKIKVFEESCIIWFHRLNDYYVYRCMCGPVNENLNILGLHFLKKILSSQCHQLNEDYGRMYVHVYSSMRTYKFWHYICRINLYHQGVTDWMVTMDTSFYVYVCAIQWELTCLGFKIFEETCIIIVSSIEWLLWTQITYLIHSIDIMGGGAAEYLNYRLLYLFCSLCRKRQVLNPGDMWEI